MKKKTHTHTQLTVLHREQSLLETWTESLFFFREIFTSRKIRLTSFKTLNGSHNFNTLIFQEQNSTTLVKEKQTTPKQPTTLTKLTTQRSTLRKPTFLTKLTIEQIIKLNNISFIFSDECKHGTNINHNLVLKFVRTGNNSYQGQIKEEHEACFNVCAIK